MIKRQYSMMEEKYLIEKVGKENPFRVPEGYFDTLSSQIMAKVEAEGVAPRDIKAGKEKRAKVLWLRPVLYAAASVCALFISVVAYQSYSEQGVAAPAQSVVANNQMITTDEYFDEAADYVMLDNEDIYACMSSDY
jgi:hypothetical protein